MSIVYHEKSKDFHIYNDYISYVIEVMENGMLKNVYYGKRIHDRDDFSYQSNDGFLMHGVCSVDGGLALQHQRQEYPACGIGDFRDSSILPTQFMRARSLWKVCPQHMWRKRVRLQVSTS